MNFLSKFIDPGKLAEGVAKLKSPLALVVYAITVVVICGTFITLSYLSFLQAQMELEQDQKQLREAQNALIEKSKEADQQKTDVDDDIKKKFQDAYAEIQEKLEKAEIQRLKLDLRTSTLENVTEKYGVDLKKLREEEAQKRIEEEEWRKSIAAMTPPAIMASDPSGDGAGPVKEDKVDEYVQSALEKPEEATEPKKPIMDVVKEKIAKKKLKFKKAKKVDWEEIPKIEQKLVDSAEAGD